MKINSLYLNLFILVFSMCLFTSCADKKPEQKPEVKQENVAVEAAYQCPMDCEKGKTYDKAGSCPVCKMDLKLADASSTE